MSATPSKLMQPVIGGASLTWGELLGFVVFFFLVGFNVLGKYSIFIALVILFITVCVY